jgi:hypothetical protein
MSIAKTCADFLRQSNCNLPTGKLRSGHAHELVAAYFGYKTAAALRSEKQYPLSALDEANILIPDLLNMDSRREKLKDLPLDLPSNDELARQLSKFIKENNFYDGDVWLDRDLSDPINGYIQNDPMVIEDQLGGEMATTNAYFDELYIDEFDYEVTDDGFAATLTGSLNGEQDPDKVYWGHKISFVSYMTMDRVAGRVAFSQPEFDTGGAVDDDYFDDDL